MWKDLLSDSKRFWRNLSISANSKYILACEANGCIYLSNDSGVSFVKLFDDDKRKWSVVSMNSTGQYMVACVSLEYVYTSSDYGVTWSMNNAVPYDRESWTDCAMSSSGEIQVLVCFDKIFTSYNYGSSWTLTMRKGAYKNITMSEDGKYISICGGGDAITSNDSGKTWSTLPLPSGINWRDVSMNASGQFQSICQYNGPVYTTNDYGKTWQSNNQTIRSYNICSSSKGDKLILSEFDGVTTPGSIWISSDYGKTFVKDTTSQIIRWQKICYNDNIIVGLYTNGYIKMKQL